MTHSLHRRGDSENFCNDYVMLVMAGKKRIQNPRVRENMGEIWSILSRYESKLANFGTVRGGGRHKKSMDEFKKENPMMIHAVFKDRETIKECLKEISDRDLGISVTLSGFHEEVEKICSESGIPAHTVQYSLGIHGKKENLPGENVLEITTMCGHAMVSPRLISSLIKKIEKGKMTHAKAAEELSNMCECRIFNPFRAERLLKEMV